MEVLASRSTSCETARNALRSSSSSASRASRSAKSSLTYFPRSSPDACFWNSLRHDARYTKVPRRAKASAACSSPHRSNETPFAFRSATCSSGFSIGLSPVTSCAPSPMLHAVYVSLGFTMPAILPLSASLGHAAFRASRIGMAKRRRMGARRAAPAATGKSEDKKRTKTCHTSTLKSSLK